MANAETNGVAPVNEMTEAVPPATAEWEDGGEWETAELPLEEALGRINPEVLEAVMQDTDEPPKEPDTVYLKAELLSEPKPTNRSTRSSRRRVRRQSSPRQQEILSPYEMEDDAVAGSGPRKRSPKVSSPTDASGLRNRRSLAADEDEFADGFSKPDERPVNRTSAADEEDSNWGDEELIAEDLAAPGALDSNPTEPAAQSDDPDSEDWF